MTKKWEKPIIEDGKLTKFNYIVQYAENLKMGINFDIGKCMVRDLIPVKSQLLTPNSRGERFNQSLYGEMTVSEQKLQILIKQVYER